MSFDILSLSIYYMISRSKGQKVARACTMRLLELFISYHYTKIEYKVPQIDNKL